jgi:hypothetical protein
MKLEDALQHLRAGKKITRGNLKPFRAESGLQLMGGADLTDDDWVVVDEPHERMKTKDVRAPKGGDMTWGGFLQFLHNHREKLSKGLCVCSEGLTCGTCLALSQRIQEAAQDLAACGGVGYHEALEVVVDLCAKLQKGARLPDPHPLSPPPDRAREERRNH